MKRLHSNNNTSNKKQHWQRTTTTKAPTTAMIIKSNSKQLKKCLIRVKPAPKNILVKVVILVILVVLVIREGIHTFQQTQQKKQTLRLQKEGPQTYNHVECSGGGSGSNDGEFTIPQRLIFTYHNNILETKQPASLYENVLNTIGMYSTLWNQSKSQVDVMFLDDQDCLDVIYTVNPRLVDPFLYEPYGAYVADICRAAALFCHGGYYFDVDIQVLKILDPEPHIEFITAKEAARGGAKLGFFQAVLAIAPQHPIMNYTLDSMVHDWYYNPKMVTAEENLVLTLTNTRMEFNPDRLYSEKNRKKLTSIMGEGFMGPQTLDIGYQKYSNTGTSWILQELSNNGPNVKYPDLYRSNAGDLCNFIVEDTKTRTVYFYSRIYGVPACSLPEESSDKS